MNKQSTILIVDDTESNIDILMELLDRYDILVALNGKSAIDILNTQRVDLILLDIVMPNFDGYETCKILKENQKTKDIPIIFITVKCDEPSIERAYDIGGMDYITKPFKPKELLARVKTQLKLRELINHLEYNSMHDYLTNVYNRRGFFEVAEKFFDRSKKNLYAIMLDIDNFKLINDSYGHPFGDIVIQEVSSIIASTLPKDAILGRVGGEEFAIVYASDMNSYEYAENIRKDIEKSELIFEDLKSVKFTISQGLAKIDDNTTSLDHLLKRADRSLYVAKRKGRNKTIFRS